MNIYKEIERIRGMHQQAALCTIVHSSGSTPRKVGAKMLVYVNGEVFGSIGGGNLEKEVVENALHQVKENEAKLFRHDLLKQHNMCCGGSVDIFIEPIISMKTLYIFGAGHTGKALARFAAMMDFTIYLIDDRKDYMDQVDLHGLNKIIGDPREILPALHFDEDSYIVILTYDHAMDRDILAYCINLPHAYLGMIGSERKVAVTKKMFTEAGIISPAQLAHVKMPVGKAIAAETPEEIAISILAEIIEIKNTK